MWLCNLSIKFIANFVKKTLWFLQFYALIQYWKKNIRFRNYFYRNIKVLIFYVFYQSYNSPGDWARELFKPSTDSASLVVKIEKNNFLFRWVFFWRWRHKEDIFWKSRPPLAGPGPQPIDPLFWLKVLLKTRSKSASIEPWIDFLAYL